MSALLSHRISRRQAVLYVGASTTTLGSCEAKPMTLPLDLVLFSYLIRPRFDVFVSGRGGHSSGVYPQTGGGTITGVGLPVGPQKVTWRFSDTGEKVSAKNMPQVKDVPRESIFLAVYIYPDDTVELVSSQNYPRHSSLGEAMISEMEAKRHGL